MPSLMSGVKVNIPLVVVTAKEPKDLEKSSAAVLDSETTKRFCLGDSNSTIVRNLIRSKSISAMKQ